MKSTFFFEKEPSTTKTIKIIIWINLLFSFLTPFLTYLIQKTVQMEGPVHWFSLSVQGIKNGWIWQLVTYFLIYSADTSISLSFLIGLFFNMLILWFTGNEIVRRYGSRNFLLFYLGAGIVSALLTLPLLFAFSQSAILVGNFPPIFSLMLLWTMLHPETEFFFFFVIKIKAKWLSALYLGIMLLSALSSGDMHYLSVESRKLLDAAGFPDAKIFASNELNEWLIADLKRQGAKIAVWGVGTHLVTAFDHPALDGVYKLSAFRKSHQAAWNYKLKLSEKMSKVSDPGILQVRRFYNAQRGSVADAIFNLIQGMPQESRIIDPVDAKRSRFLSNAMEWRDLLVPIFREGSCCYQKPTLSEIQAFCKQELALFDKGIKRFYNPHSYPVGLEESLYQLKWELIDQMRMV